jgi:hypothetical protein
METVNDVRQPPKWNFAQVITGSSGADVSGGPEREKLLDLGVKMKVLGLDKPKSSMVVHCDQCGGLSNDMKSCARCRVRFLGDRGVGAMLTRLIIFCRSSGTAVPIANVRHGPSTRRIASRFGTTRSSL